MNPYDILDKWEDHFDTPDPCALEEIMFEVKHNIVDIERFEKGIEQECKREFNEEFWEEIDFLKANLDHHAANPQIWSGGAYGPDYSRALYESRRLIKLLKPLFTGDEDSPGPLKWGEWNIKHPY